MASGFLEGFLVGQDLLDRRRSRELQEQRLGLQREQLGLSREAGARAERDLESVIGLREANIARQREASDIARRRAGLDALVTNENLLVSEQTRRIRAEEAADQNRDRDYTFNKNRSADARAEEKRSKLEFATALRDTGTRLASMPEYQQRDGELDTEWQARVAAAALSELTKNPRYEPWVNRVTGLTGANDPHNRPNPEHNGPASFLPAPSTSGKPSVAVVTASGAPMTNDGSSRPDAQVTTVDLDPMDILTQMGPEAGAILAPLFNIDPELLAEQTEARESGELPPAAPPGSLAGRVERNRDERTGPPRRGGRPGVRPNLDPTAAEKGAFNREQSELEKLQAEEAALSEQIKELEAQIREDTAETGGGFLSEGNEAETTRGRARNKATLRRMRKAWTKLSSDIVKQARDTDEARAAFTAAKESLKISNSNTPEKAAQAAAASGLDINTMPTQPAAQAILNGAGPKKGRPNAQERASSLYLVNIGARTPEEHANYVRTGEVRPDTHTVEDVDNLRIVTNDRTGEIVSRQVIDPTKQAKNEADIAATVATTESTRLANEATRVENQQAADAAAIERNERHAKMFGKDASWANRTPGLRDLDPTNRDDQAYADAIAKTRARLLKDTTLMDINFFEWMVGARDLPDGAKDTGHFAIWADARASTHKGQADYIQDVYIPAANALNSVYGQVELNMMDTFLKVSEQLTKRGITDSDAEAIEEFKRRFNPAGDFIRAPLRGAPGAVQFVRQASLQEIMVMSDAEVEALTQGRIKTRNELVYRTMADVISGENADKK